MASPYKTSVIELADSNNLTVLETVKQELGITSSDSDALLSRYIREQSDAVSSYCGRVFSQETIVDSFDASSTQGSPLILSRRPIISVESVIDGSDVLAAESYELDYGGGRVWRLDTSGSRSFWGDKVVVTYIGGFQLLETLPSGIERATIILVKQAFFDRYRDPRTKSENVDGIGSMSLLNEPMSCEVEELLRPYRNIFC